METAKRPVRKGARAGLAAPRSVGSVSHRAAPAHQILCPATSWRSGGTCPSHGEPGSGEAAASSSCRSTAV